MTEENLYDGPTEQVFPITWQAQIVIPDTVIVVAQQVFMSDKQADFQQWADRIQAENPMYPVRFVTPHDEGFVVEH